jgi:putative serine protease PepD
VLDRRLARHHELVQRAAVEVMSVSRRGPAAEAGLIDGDLLLSLGTRAVASIDELQGVLREWPPGQPAPLRVLRRGKALELTAVPTEPP